MQPRRPIRDEPWVMRTYAGHSSARATNELFRENLSKGQTGLSVAFDLPTQLGLDPDAPMALGEVGRVGVPVGHLDHLRELFAGLPLGQMNTSMTINATAVWLYSLYLALAEETGADLASLRGTTQNDVVKEYLSRGAFVFSPVGSRRLMGDLVAFAATRTPKWNPINVCSYHLQEAGATPAQEVAFALATAVGVLDDLSARPEVSRREFTQALGRISFFVNAGIRFIEEIAKVRAFGELWEWLCRERYGVDDPVLTRFRYGVQVNSLGLTQAQPENNAYRIVLEALAVTLSRVARARALQLPAWNEAIGLPRPIDQQWSLRAQQILAYETDLLEYEDIFEGSKVMEALTAEVRDAARELLDEVLAGGGAFEQLDAMKAALVASQTARVRAIETGERVVVGVNRFHEGGSLLAGAEGAPRQEVDVEEVARLIERFREARAKRDQTAVDRARRALADAAREGSNLVEPSIALARVGGTTGEWTDTLREVFGEHRPSTGVGAHPRARREELSLVAERVRRLPGGPPRVLVAKPGLDGHSNGAEQIAVACRDAGFEVVYQGIRQSTSSIAATARDEDVELIGLSILSGAHLELVAALMEECAAIGLEVPVVVGGIIPEADRERLAALGVRAVFGPTDYSLGQILDRLVDLVIERRNQVQPATF
jgi:(2R)-ethylmalonyl-CoA mutase